MGSDPQTREVALDPLLRVRDLTKRYAQGGLWRKHIPVEAVRNVDFEIFAGRTLALVGESGSGKSTIARCLARLEKPDSGQIWIGGKDLANLTSRELLPFRSDIQMLFQDAVTSMNPRFSAAEVVEEPLLIRRQDAERRREAVRTFMNEVGLSPDWADRSVLHFSGGQRQRLAIARALVVRPKLLILDEALSGLDLSTQAQTANLLRDLQAAHSLTFLLISHDLALVARMADDIAVMSGGQIVEMGPAQDMMTAPKHEETVRLLASAKAIQSRLATITGAPA